MDEDESIIEQAIEHLMEATRLLESLKDRRLGRETLQPVAEAAGTLRARANQIRSSRTGERWPPTPEISG